MLKLKNTKQTESLREWLAMVEPSNVCSVATGCYGEFVCTEIIVEGDERVYHTTYIMIDGTVRPTK